MTVAWITGGGTGIGRALAEALYQEGAHVIISGRRQTVLETTAEEIASKPGTGQILAVPGDAANPYHVRHIVEEARKQWGDIDLLINNAGANLDAGHDRPDPERYQKSLEVNLFTAIRATEAVLPAMRQMKGGSIINISSIFGRSASADSPTYTVAKHAVAGYTDAMRPALAEFGIHVMGVYPGFIKTDMTMPFVKSGSIRSFMGKTPARLASVILKALKHKKPELYYPWYVPWALRMYRWMPVLAPRVARRIKQ